ncbi:MAG: protein-L-isoaspartate(D-aspartate) O-methyltransferase [Candidatus Kapaibacterium sp.]|nr:MAG: protein-L-isoaspartate(D-aspartate) O-methyltransferase [Candidatus Kapabacteria bacterium]
MLRAKGISNEAVLRAISAVRREDFVQEILAARAYENVALPIGFGQTISQPFTVAYMTELLAPTSTTLQTSKVLEIGTGSGYQTAVLAAMGIRALYTIECVRDLYEETRERFVRLGIPARMRFGDGSLGWIDAAPFDGIIVTAGSPDVPEGLAHQLAVGGRMIIPVGSQREQTIYRITRQSASTGAEAFRAEEFQGFRFVPLIGKAAWRQ